MTSSAPIDKSDPSLHLVVPPFVVHIAQYPPGTAIPPSLLKADIPFLSITRSPGEITILYGADTSDDAGTEWLASSGLPEPIAKDGPYAVLRVRGPLVLCMSSLLKSCRLLPREVISDCIALTGILNELTTPLRSAAVPVYAVSTWYVLPI